MKKLYAFSAIFLLFFLGINLCVFSQGNKIIPTTPEAAALAKSINYPVGYDTGIPSINVPLHHIKIGGLELPIGINYHSGGFKVGELCTNVGMGWSMSINLQITRSVAGKDDLDSLSNYKGYYYNTNLGPYNESISMPYANIGDPKLLARIERGDEDYQPDQFNFSILGKSGTFYFQKHGYGVTSTTSIVTIPYSDIKIEYLESGHAFKITDNDGTIYFFGNPNAPNSLDSREISEQIGGEINAQITAWKCTKIISPSKADEINFEYEHKADEYSYSYPDRCEVYTNSNYNGSGGIYPPRVHDSDLEHYTLYDISNLPFQTFGTPKFYNYNLGLNKGFYMVSPPHPVTGIQRVTRYNLQNGLPFDPGPVSVTKMYGLSLKKISFRGGEVDFSYDNDRITSIKLYDSGNQELKEFELSQSMSTAYGPSSVLPYIFKGTYYLDSVRIKKNNVIYEKYGFEYVNKPSFTNTSSGSDPWGYYNANSSPFISSVNAIPAQMLSSSEQIGECDWWIGSGILSVGTAAFSGQLKKITYPGGGYTTFSFGQNRYDDDGTGYLAGGLRIDSIKYYDGSNPSVSAFERHYKYGPAENGKGILKCKPAIGTYSYTQTIKYGNTQDIQNDGIPENDIWGATISQANKTTYLPASFLDLSYSSGSPVRYTEVAEYQKDKGQITGKTIYNYSLGNNDFNPVYIKEGTNLTIKQSDWHIGKLLKESRLRCKDGIYDTVFKKIYSYEQFLLPDQVFVGHVFRKTIYEGITPLINDAVYLEDDFDYVPIGRRVGEMLLSSEQEIWTEGNAALTKNTRYHYDTSAHLKPNRTETTVSGGKSIINYVTYPQDYATTNDFIKNLVDNNMLSSPIESVSVTREGTDRGVVAGQITTYKTDNSGLTDKIFELDLKTPIVRTDFKLSNHTLLDTITKTTFLSDSRYKEKTVFHYDDKKNINIVQPKYDPAKGYKWGYNKLYPIAECINADSTEFFVENFEEASGTTQTEVHTGKNARQGSYTVNWTPPNARKYVISYWYYNLGWRYSGEIPYTGNSYYAVGLYIDDVRIYPADALMSTYTYSPLIGMTSAIDARSQTTYYEYDDLQRLISVKDHNRNIIKQYCYNYAGQRQTCYTIGLNAPFYVRLEIGGYWTDEDSDYIDNYGAAYLRFYSDAGCTQPYTLMSDIRMYVKGTYSWHNNIEGSGNDYFYENYIATAGTSEYNIGDFFMDTWELDGVVEKWTQYSYMVDFNEELYTPLSTLLE